MLGTSQSGDDKENGKNRSRRLDGCLCFRLRAVFEIAWVFWATFWCFYAGSVGCFVWVGHQFPTAGHLVFWGPCPWVGILERMFGAGAESLSTAA